MRLEAQKQFGQAVNEGGYYMRTTLDPRLRRCPHRADGRAGDLRPPARLARPLGKVAISPGWEKAALQKAPAVPSQRKWRVAVVEEVGGSVKVKLADNDAEGQLVPADASWARAGKGLAVGDLILVDTPPTGGVFLKYVDGAMVVMDPTDGRVLAMVGGYSFSLSNFNRATQGLAPLVVQAIRLRHRAGERLHAAASSRPDDLVPPAPTARPGRRNFKELPRPAAGSSSGAAWSCLSLSSRIPLFGAPP